MSRILKNHLKYILGIKELCRRKTNLTNLLTQNYFEGNKTLAH